MSLLLNYPSKLCFWRPVLVRSSPLVSTSLPQTPPCSIIGAKRYGPILNNEGKLTVMYADTPDCISLNKTVPWDLVSNSDDMVTIGSSHGWVATRKRDDGLLRLQDDLNPGASYTDPKRIPLPPLVTLPHCQTQIVTNVSMSTSSPEDEDCVVAVKFLGSQISFCKPAQRNSEWTNIRIENPCFFSSRVMFSKKDEMFRMPGSGGHLIASWDLRGINTKLHSVRLRNLPKLSKKQRELLDSCTKTEHLVESRSTGETFLIKWYKKTTKIIKGVARMKTKALIVFKLDEQGNALYTQDIGDLAIFLSKSEPFCVTASSFPNMHPNKDTLLDVDEVACVCLTDISPWVSIGNGPLTIATPFYIPPQNIE